MSGRQLDLLSPEFDPEAALSAPSLSVPFPNVKPLNNLSECRRLLPSTAPMAYAVKDPRELQPGSKHVARARFIETKCAAAPTAAGAHSTPVAEQAAASLADATQSRLSSEQQQPPRPLTLTQRWAAGPGEGPLGALWQLRQQRVRVLTRGTGGLRGWCAPLRAASRPRSTISTLAHMLARPG